MYIKENSSLKNGFYKTLLKLALPIALQNLMTFSVGFSDVIMIGRLGDTAVSGVYMGNQIQILLQTFVVGVEGAITVLSAQYWGKRDSESAKKICAVGTAFSLSVAVLLTALCLSTPKFVISLFTDIPEIARVGAEYLKILAPSFPLFCITQALTAAMRSVENVKISMLSSAIALLINLSLDYALIFGKFGAPRLYGRGAAVATVTARAAEFGVVMIYVLFFDKKLKIKPKEFFRFEKKLTVDFFKYGAPVILGQAVWAVNTLSAPVIIGRHSGSAVTALSVASTLNSLAYTVTNGLSGGIGIITGKSVGAGERESVRKYAGRAQLIFIALGILTGAALYAARGPFVSLYNISGEARLETYRFITVLTVLSVFTCYQSICLFGLLKSGGDMRFVFFTELCSVFLAVIPASLVASRLGLPTWCVFAALKCDQVLKCIPAAVRVNRFKWTKNLTCQKSAAP